MRYLLSPFSYTYYLIFPSPGGIPLPKTISKTILDIASPSIIIFLIALNRIWLKFDTNNTNNVNKKPKLNREHLCRSVLTLLWLFFSQHQEKIFHWIRKRKFSHPFFLKWKVDQNKSVTNSIAIAISQSNIIKIVQFLSFLKYLTSRMTQFHKQLDKGIFESYLQYSFRSLWIGRE